MELESEKKSVEEQIEEYKDDVAKLSAYLPWLEKKSGQNLMSIYRPDSMTSFSIPTYDSTLLAFIKEIENTQRVNRNYDYVYKKYRIFNEKDEVSLTHRAGLEDMDMLFAILSRYVIKGRTKGLVWKSGVENGVYLEVVRKMKELIEFWSMPM